MKKNKMKKIVMEQVGVDLSLKTRKRHYIDARAMYYSMCKKYATDDRSLTSIGKTVGKDHATVLYGLKLDASLQETNRDYRYHWQTINNLCKKEHLSEVRFKDTDNAYGRITHLEYELKRILDLYKELKKEYAVLKRKSSNADAKKQSLGNGYIKFSK